MKKLLFTFVLIFSGVASFAQYSGDYPQVTFGLSGGSNFTSFYVNAAAAYKPYISSDLESPISLGINADYKFNDYFSIRPGIFYAGKGGTLNAVYVNAQGDNVSVYDDYKLHYLEIPIDFIGHLPIGSEGANIFLGAGPYFSIGLNGKNTQTLYDDDPQVFKIKYGRNGDFKSTDMGLTTVLGFQAASGWAISVNFDLGVTNILQNNNTNIDLTGLRTGTFYLSVGHTF